MDPAIAAPTLVTSGIALFTITNPIGTLPIFLSLTKGQTAAQQRRTAVLVGLAVAVVLVVSLLAGNFILGWFGIDITAFKIAGNALVATIGWAMLTAKAGGAVSVAPGESPVVVPLAIPVLAGPGAIALAITFAHGYTGLVDYVFGGIVCAVVGLLVAVVFFVGPWIAKALGTTGMSILTRVFGLLLLAIAVQSIMLALGDAFPGLFAGTGQSTLLPAAPAPTGAAS
ncbi:MAG: NAAT family transporter [Microbacteriaceae bacterium]|nr:NAAT family transporter [Microbacteriaceae bacterium]